jgi:hypothetical protein
VESSFQLDQGIERLAAQFGLAQQIEPVVVECASMPARRSA